jgi:hypothetical protein
MSAKPLPFSLNVTARLRAPVLLWMGRSCPQSGVPSGSACLGLNRCSVQFGTGSLIYTLQT